MRNFYHSFVRPRPNEDQDALIDKSLKILQSIKRHGLMLAPEVIKWTIPLSDNSEKVIRHRQVRICFTELEREELPLHAKRFGPISLEFSIESLRRLAAIPAIYLPQTLRGEPALSSAGSVMAWVFDMLKYTLDRLDQLSKIAKPDVALALAKKQNPDMELSVASDYKLNLCNVDHDGKVVADFEVSAETIRGILAYIGYKNAPLELMHGAVSAAQSLFYPTDDEMHDELLAYYRQREWKIIPGFSKDGEELGRLLRDEEKQDLYRIDERFWSRKIADDKGEFCRVDEARVIDSFHGRPIEAFIQKIIVPARIADAVKDLFGAEKVEINEQ